MIDSDAVVVAVLSHDANLAHLAGTRIYASADLPPGYTPEQGPAILLSARGGVQDFSSKVLTPSYQFRLYAATEAQARAMSDALYHALNDESGATFKWARLETLPVLLRDDVTGWPYALAFYQFWIGNP